VEKLILPAIMENLDPMLDFVEKSAHAAGFEKAFLNKIRLVCEEALVNIINYAYPNSKGEVKIQCGVDTDRATFVIQITDSGLAFNPFERPDPDITLSVQDREIGGLGIFMIRQIMDQFSYKRDNDHNVMLLEKKLP
jgi:anti-sigma regulatory factor (Ser/Thr protein kinase)